MACNLSPFGTEDENLNEVDKTVIEENSTLFVAEDSNYIFETNDSKYLKQNGVTLWCVKDINASTSFEEIEVNVSKQNGKSEAGYGVIFMQQEYEGKDFLLTIMINTKGEFILGKVFDGKFTAIRQWQSCSYLNKGYGIKNKINISMIDNTFRLKLNGYTITDFSISEKINIQNSKSGYVVVVSGNENFPNNSVKVIFEKN